MTLPAGAAISAVRSVVAGLPAFIVGSSVAAARYRDISDLAYEDVDVFVASPAALVSTVEKLLVDGYTFNDRFERAWERWLRHGLPAFHTNSIKLTNQHTDIEVNIVYRTISGQPTTSLAQVIESFDFGLLSVGGWDCVSDTYRDMRSFLFPRGQSYGKDHEAMPLLPNKKSDWDRGFISQYNGLREIGRYIKYLDYGYDMSLVKPSLLKGYRIAAEYHLDKDSLERQKLGEIFLSFHDRLIIDDLDSLREASKTILFRDSLDDIMESLQ